MKFPAVYDTELFFTTATAHFSFPCNTWIQSLHETNNSVRTILILFSHRHQDFPSGTVRAVPHYAAFSSLGLSSLRHHILKHTETTFTDINIKN
jgi:hypothetical protein